MADYIHTHPYSSDDSSSSGGGGGDIPAASPRVGGFKAMHAKDYRTYY